MSKNYSLREELTNETREKLKAFSDLSAHLLFHRGLKEHGDASNFLLPQYEKGIHDPFKLSDMEKSVERILKAIKDNEKTVIFSDYDADGIPGAVVLHDLFKKAGHKNFSNYIPHRGEEGFGLSKEALESFAKDGVHLVITIDCGIADIEEAALAKELGLDLIITDHHLPKEILPPAFAIVNPKISPDYAEPMLCGAAVAFKLAQAILAKNNFGMKPGEEKWLLDMVGIATLSDMVPLTGENRIFAYYGLLVLRKSRRLGLTKLLRKLKIDQKKLTEDDIGFMIAPRINAASRMGVSMDAFRLLVSEDENEANILVDHLEKINNERKGATAFIAKEVHKVIEAKYSPYFSNKVIVAGSPTWKPSLLGLVAGSIAETHGKPVFLWGKEGAQEALKGSCRGVGEVNLAALMSGVTSGVFTEFGGHTLAGGFSVSYESVHLLEEELECAYEKLDMTAAVEPSWIDRKIFFSDVNLRTLSDIEKLAPYGVGNPKPLFEISGGRISEISFFGKEKNHLKLIIEKENGGLVEAIQFFVTEDLLKKAEPQKNVSLIGHIERAAFGKFPVRVRIVDII